MPEPTTGSLLDDFNRADDATPPPGANWTNGVQTFVAGEGIAIVTNQACRAATGGYRQGGYYNARQPGPDVDIVAEISSLVDTNGDGFFVFGRLKEVAAGTVDGYCLAVERVSATTYTMAIWRIVNGVSTTLATSANFTLAVGDLVALQMIGSALTGWNKSGAGAWTSMVTATDAQITTAGYVGLEFVGNQSGKITNLWATGLVSLSASVAGQGALSPTLTATEALQAVVAGQGALAANPDITRALQVAIAGLGTVSGSLSLTEALNLAAAGVGTLTADLTTGAIKELATAIAGQAAVGSDLVITRALEAVIAGIAQIAPALNSQTALNTVIAGGGTLVATLTIQGEPIAVVVQDGVFSLYSYTY